MGFDLLAEHPTAPQYESFRANNCWWYVLWTYACAVARLSDFDRRQGYFNNGYLINEKTAIRIGKAILNDFKNGEKEYLAIRHRIYFEALSHPRHSALCILERAFTREFAAFCLNSGGFRIG